MNKDFGMNFFKILLVFLTPCFSLFSQEFECDPLVEDCDALYEEFLDELEELAFDELEEADEVLYDELNASDLELSEFGFLGATEGTYADNETTFFIDSETQFTYVVGPPEYEEPLDWYDEDIE